jgi:hypothetical protein
MAAVSHSIVGVQMGCMESLVACTMQYCEAVAAGDDAGCMLVA